MSVLPVHPVPPRKSSPLPARWRASLRGMPSIAVVKNTHVAPSSSHTSGQVTRGDPGSTNSVSTSPSESRISCAMPSADVGRIVVGHDHALASGHGPHAVGQRGQGLRRRDQPQRVQRAIVAVFGDRLRLACRCPPAVRRAGTFRWSTSARRAVRAPAEWRRRSDRARRPVR